MNHICDDILKLLKDNYCDSHNVELTESALLILPIMIFPITQESNSLYVLAITIRLAKIEFVNGWQRTTTDKNGNILLLNLSINGNSAANYNFDIANPDCIQDIMVSVDAAVKFLDNSYGTNAL